MKLKHFINKAPFPVRQGLKYAYGLLPLELRYGKQFNATFDYLNESERWPYQKLENNCMKTIRGLLDHSFNNVPYYRNFFKKYSVNINDIQTASDLYKLPFLTKEDVKLNYSDLIARNVNMNDCVVTNTGGSTSEPMRFLVDPNFNARELAFFKYAWGKFGFKLGSRCVKLKGDKVARPQEKNFWVFDPAFNYLAMDSDYLNDPNATIYYLKKIKNFGSRYLFGFPSSVYLLAKQIESHDFKCLPEPELIMLASENVYDWQLDYIKKVLNCKNIFFHYGHSEQAALAVKCLNKDILHFLPQYGYVELVNSKGGRVKQGEVGEIVATSYNKCFPLIRYRTKDFAVLSNEKCGCLWENYLTVTHIEGRLQEFIVRKDNRLVSICTMGAAHFEELEEVMSTEYYQDTAGKLVLRIVPMPNHGLSDRVIANIKLALEKKLEHMVNVSIEIVDSINKTRSGKHKMIDQRINIDNLM